MHTALAFASAAGIVSGFFALALVGAVLLVLVARRFRTPAVEEYLELPVPAHVVAGVAEPASILSDRAAVAEVLEMHGLPGEGTQLESFGADPYRRGLSNCKIEDCEPCGRVMPEPFRFIMLPACPDAVLLKASRDEEGNVLVEGVAPGEVVIEGEVVLDEEPPVEQLIDTIRSFRGTELALTKLSESALGSVGALAEFTGVAPEAPALEAESPAAGLDVESVAALTARAFGGASETSCAPGGAFEHTFKGVDRKVVSVDIISKSHVTVRAGEKSGPSVMAVALNAAGEVVRGARIKFKTTNPARLFVDQKTGTVAGQPGEKGYASVYAVCQGVESERVRVRVK